MKTLREYLERNQYSIVKSLAELLSISDEEAKDFYSALSIYDEGKVVDALKDGAPEDLTDHVKELFTHYQSQSVQEGEGEEKPRFTIETGPNGEYEIWDNKKGVNLGSAHSGHEAHNLLYSYKQAAKNEVDEAKKSPRDISKMAGKAQAGGYDMARELAKGQYQPKVVQNKKFKSDRQDAKVGLKRGMYENSITPVIVNENNEYKFKLLNSSLVAGNSNIEAIFESTIMISPMGGLSSVPGVGMSGLRRMAGIEAAPEPVATEMGVEEIESNDVNQVLSIISQLDDVSRSCLINLLTMPQEETPQVDPEHVEMVKFALRDFGCALQCWIEDSCGALDFLVPLVDSLWVKYNEF